MTKVRLAVAALAAAVSACAAVGEATSPGPPPFSGVRTLALVRLVDEPAGARPRDPLDALAESLAARGYETRLVEIGPGSRDDRRDVERLHARLDGWIAGAPPRSRFRSRRSEPIGGDAGEVVARLGVDAVAMYHRFEGHLPAIVEPPPASPFPPVRVARRPLGALSLVDRDGNAIWFDWGTPGPDPDESAPVNAAEAIELVLRALSGEAEDG